MVKLIKVLKNVIYFSVSTLTFAYMVNSGILAEKKHSIVSSKNIELNDTIIKDKEKYESTIMEIVKTIQITDSYLFIGGFNQEESAAFNIKRYEDMLTLKTDLDNLLENTENFFDERKEYLEGLPNIWPMRKDVPIRISSPWGDRYSPFTGSVYFHEGVDLVSPAGTEIIATSSGVVVTHWLNHPVFGRYVVVELENGLRVHYAHLSKSFVVNGSKIERGQVIGIIGNSGQSTGTHLHYAISRNGVWLDPAGFLESPEILLTKKE